MNCDEIVSGLILEFRRGTLIMVVLAQLNKPMYGYSLIKELEGKGISIEGKQMKRSRESITSLQKMENWFIKKLKHTGKNFPSQLMLLWRWNKW